MSWVIVAKNEQMNEEIVLSEITSNEQNEKVYPGLCLVQSCKMDDVQEYGLHFDSKESLLKFWNGYKMGGNMENYALNLDTGEKILLEC